MVETDPHRLPGGTTVWLARHGDVHNPDNLLYGRLPRMRLSPEGQRQADALADFLAERPIAGVYASPMLRARRTAEAVAARHQGQRVRQDRDLMEILTGWQGHPLHALDGIGWDFYGNARNPGDETLGHIRDRMRRWVDRVVRRHAGADVVGVSHGDPLLIVTADLRGGAMELATIRPEVYIPTACVFRLRFDATDRYHDQELFVPHAA